MHHRIAALITTTACLLAVVACAKTEPAATVTGGAPNTTTTAPAAASSSQPSTGASSVVSSPTAQAEATTVFTAAFPGLTATHEMTAVGSCPDGQPGGSVISVVRFPQESAPLKAPAVLDALAGRGWTAGAVTKTGQLDRITAKFTGPNSRLLVNAVPAHNDVPDFIGIYQVVPCDQPQLAQPPVTKRDPKTGIVMRDLFQNYEPPTNVSATTKKWFGRKDRIRLYTPTELDCAARWLEAHPEQDSAITRDDEASIEDVWRHAAVGCVTREKFAQLLLNTLRISPPQPYTNCLIDMYAQTMTDDQIVGPQKPLHAQVQVGVLEACPDYSTS